MSEKLIAGLIAMIIGFPICFAIIWYIHYTVYVKWPKKFKEEYGHLLEDEENG